jgi:hypothetical protein
MTRDAVVPAQAGTHSLRPIRLNGGGHPWHSKKYNIGSGGYPRLRGDDD